MAEKSEEIEQINATRARITRLTEIISQEKPVTSIIKDNPAAAIIVMVVLGILTALLSRGLVKLLLKLISFSLKISTFVILVKQSLPLLEQVKKFRK